MKMKTTILIAIIVAALAGTSLSVRAADAPGTTTTTTSTPTHWHHHHYYRPRTSVFFGLGLGSPYGYGYGSPYGYGYPSYGYNPYYNSYPYGYNSYGAPRTAIYETAPASRYGSVVAQVQQRLARAGYYRGSIDGVIGSGTRRAIRAYERSHGLPIDGRIDSELLANLGLA